MTTPRYAKEYRLRTHRAGGALRVDAAPFRRMIQDWVNAGYTLVQIETASGYCDDGLAGILNGTRTEINPGSAEKLLATRMNPDMIPDYLTTDATGSRRRLQALAVIGYPSPVLAAELGRSLHFVSDLVREHHHTVRRRYATQVTDLYLRWSSTPGPSKHARTLAAKRGWHGPDAWDGEDLDDPKAQPNTVICLDAFALAEERSTEVQLLASAGNTFEVIANRIGISQTGVRQILRRDNPNLYLELTA